MAISSGSPLAGDMQAISALRGKAAQDPKAAIREAAKQFESLFMQQLMKSMRDASLASGMLDNSGTKMGTEMLDQQFAQQMTGMPGGLSDAIARQLERQMGEPLANIASDSAKAAAGIQNAAMPRAAESAAGQPASSAGLRGLNGKERQVGFLKTHDNAAKAAEAKTGIPAAFMVAQAAHETGWGRHEIKNPDGSASFNVFGIKAGSGWKGPTTTVTTTEVIDGVARKVKAKFRAYASYEESFTDYAQMMKNNPRYSKVVSAGTSAQGFATGLQKAGYATDPAYADKLSKMINTTLNLRRSMA
jgi:peptidoglycan hydrolase FlgJ